MITYDYFPWITFPYVMLENKLTMHVSSLHALQRNEYKWKKYVVTSDLFFRYSFFQVTVILNIKLINIPFLQNDWSIYLSLYVCLHNTCILLLETILTAITDKTLCKQTCFVSVLKLHIPLVCDSDVSGLPPPWYLWQWYQLLASSHYLWQWCQWFAPHMIFKVTVISVLCLLHDICDHDISGCPPHIICHSNISGLPPHMIFVPVIYVVALLKLFVTVLLVVCLLTWYLWQWSQVVHPDIFCESDISDCLLTLYLWQWYQKLPPHIIFVTVISVVASSHYICDSDISGCLLTFFVKVISVVASSHYICDSDISGCLLTFFCESDISGCLLTLYL